MSVNEIEQFLSREDQAVRKGQEIERILNCYAYDYLSILEINPFVNPEKIADNVKKSYRKKTLLVHPDKTDHKDAPLAFDRLKKAELVLSQMSSSEETSGLTEKRLDLLLQEKERLLAIYNDVSSKLLSARKELSSDSEKFMLEVRNGVKDILQSLVKSEEIDRNYQQEQESKRKAEEEERYKQREHNKKVAAQWEDDRDTRVKNWRSYTHKIEKARQKKLKKHVNGKKKFLA